MFLQLKRMQANWLSSFAFMREHSGNVIKDMYWSLRHFWRSRKNARQWAEEINTVSKRIKITGAEDEYCACVHDIPVPNEIFKGVEYVKFENMLVPCPVGYKKCLEIKYGDYMTLPPESERVTVYSFDAYWC